MRVSADEVVMDAVRLLRATPHEYYFSRPSPESLRSFLQAVAEALGSDAWRLRWRLEGQASATVWLEKREGPADFA